MKKLNKVLAGAMAIPALAVVAPTITLTSCGNKKNHLSIAEEGKKFVLSGNYVFDVVFDTSFRLQTTDKFEVEVVDAQTEDDLVVSFEYNKSRSLDDESGLKAVFTGTLTKESGAVPEDNTNIKFGMKINYSSESVEKTWSESFGGFNVSYESEGSNVELAPGQASVLTQPGSDIQFIKFQLNGTHVSEDTSSIQFEAIMGAHSDDVTGVEIVSVAAGHRVFDVETDTLYVWVRLITNSQKNDDETWAEFNPRIICYEWVDGVQTLVWQKTFDDESQKIKLIRNKAQVTVLEEERNGTRIDHNAGTNVKTYRMFYDKYYATKTVTVNNPEIVEGSEIDNISCEIGGEKELEGFLYREITITYGKTSGDLEDGDTADFDLSVNFTGEPVSEHPLGRFLYEYVSAVVANPSEDTKSKYTKEGDDQNLFTCQLMNSYSYDDTHHIQYTIVPNDDHTRNTTVENRRQNVIVSQDDTKMEWDVTIKNTAHQKLKVKDYAGFSVIFTGFDNDQKAKWRHQFDGYDLMKFNTPITPSTSMDQIIDPTEDSAIYKLNLASSIDKSTPDDLEIKEIKILGTSTHALSIKEDECSIKFAMGQHNAILLTLPLEGEDGINDGDFVEFQVTIHSKEEGYEWDCTLPKGRIDVWGGFTLWRGVNIEVTARGDTQWYLSSGTDEVIKKDTPIGATSKVTIDTSVWDAETATDWPENKQWELCIPEDPEKGMLNYYHYVEDSIQITLNGQKVEKDQYMVSSGGPIIFNRGLINKGDILEFRLELAGSPEITKIKYDTRFYFGYINR